MKNVIKRMALISALLMVALMKGYAQESTQVKKTVEEIVKKYDGTKGVECMSLVKGGGLDMVKMMFRKQFGKDFMKGVTSITIIEYGDAPEETCLALRKDLDAFVSLLEEFNLGEDKKSANNDYVRCFASVSSETATLSDFVFALEDEETKMVMYMAGVMKIE